MADLKDIKPGDFIAITSHYARTPTKRQVARVTATQAVVSDGRRFMKATGREVGAVGTRCWAYPWTSEHDRRIVDAERLAQQKAILAQQKAIFERMLADFDRAVSEARQLRYRDRLVPEQAIAEVGEVLKKAGAMVAEAVKAIGS